MRESFKQRSKGYKKNNNNKQTKINNLMSHWKDIYAFPGVQPRQVQNFLFLTASDPLYSRGASGFESAPLKWTFPDGYFEACRAPDTCVRRPGEASVRDMRGRPNYPGLKWGCRSGVSPATTALGPSYSFTFKREASLYDIGLLSLQRAVYESWTAGSGATAAVLTEKAAPVF